MLLSIGLMVKNESKHLEQCLHSLLPILNELDSELIIVDTGSTDNTVEIANRYTEKVYSHEWFDDFAGMRNIVLSYAVGEWFFYVDGDEVVEDASGIMSLS
jgi:glycosyltransferase involved in cell wall biosynthesis